MSAVIDLATHRRQRALKRTRDAMRRHPVYDALDAWRSAAHQSSMGPAVFSFSQVGDPNSWSVPADLIDQVALPCDTEPA